MDEAVDLESALSEIADPAVRQVLRMLQDEVRAQAGVVADYEALLQEYQALLAENVALREELARIGGPERRNRLERSLAEKARLRAERQRLRDEVALLMGATTTRS